MTSGLTRPMTSGLTRPMTSGLTPPMIELTRRQLLRGALGAFVVAHVPLFVRPAWAGAAGRVPLLVVVFLRGGADGLALVPPLGDAGLERTRGALLARSPIELGGSAAGRRTSVSFGLHPAFAPLAPLARDGRLAAIHAVGWPAPVRSHFEAQDLCERAGARPGDPAEGWLARALAAGPEPPSAFRAFAAAQARPRALAGDPRALALATPAALRLPATSANGSRAIAALFAAPAVSERSAAARFALAGSEMLGALAALRAHADAPLVNQDAFPPSPFGAELATVARLARADLGVAAAWVDAFGWDTHVRQGADEGPLARSIGDLARGLSALVAALDDRAGDLLVLVVSEFGRNAAPNGSGGTDHGRGGAALALGGAVRGGAVYGAWPGARRDELEDGRDLRVATDVRDVLAEGARHLGVRDLVQVFPGYAPRPLGLLRTPT